MREREAESGLRVRGGRPPPLVHTLLLGLLCVPPVIVVIRLFYRSQAMPFPIGSPLWVLAGIVLAMGVATCFGSTVALLVRACRWVKRRCGRPPAGQAGWLADHRWESGGETRSPAARWWRASSNSGLMFWVLWQPVYWLRALSSSTDAKTLYVGMLIFALPLTWFAYRWLKFVTGGAARVTFVDAPYRPGQPIRLYFGLRGAGRAENLRFHLRCVRESASPLPPVLSAFLMSDAEGEELWCRCPTAPLDPATVSEPDSDIELHFSPPAEAPGTSLAATYPTYWELLVEGDTNVGRYEDRFLIPVYDADA